MNVRIRLDHKGMGEMLRSGEVAFAVAARAAVVQDIAEAHQSVTRHRMPVERHVFESDRAGQDVTIEHPGGLPVEAKYGVLADAGRVAGLEVTAVEPRRT